MYACFVVRSHFLAQSAADVAHASTMMARAALCELHFEPDLDVKEESALMGKLAVEREADVGMTIWAGGH